MVPHNRDALSEVRYADLQGVSVAPTVIDSVMLAHLKAEKFTNSNTPPLSALTLPCGPCCGSWTVWCLIKQPQAR
jgi:hypothetical protein